MEYREYHLMIELEEIWGKLYCTQFLGVVVQATTIGHMIGSCEGIYIDHNPLGSVFHRFSNQVST